MAARATRLVWISHRRSELAKKGPWLKNGVTSFSFWGQQLNTCQLPTKAPPICKKKNCIWRGVKSKRQVPLLLAKQLGELGEEFRPPLILLWTMESLPIEIYQKIFLLLDHQHLAIAQQVCRNWKSLASQNLLWYNLFKKRWGKSSAEFYGPASTKSWKDVYEVQDRCDRVGLGLKIIREGSDYYIVHEGEIQRHLGSIIGKKEEKASRSIWPVAEEPAERDEPSPGLLDKILFFIGDLEVALCKAKRSRLL